MTLIYSPLNLTAFVHLVGHLHDVGYPAHWLNETLSEMLTGRITTAVRPPRSEPLNIKEAQALWPAISQSTVPFVAELSTLLSIWQLALPFGLIACSLPDIDKVRNPSAIRYATSTPAFVLALWKLELLPPRSNLRHYLLSDEKPCKARSVTVPRRWTWDRETKIASFWLRQDVMEKIKSGTWMIAILRTDDWEF
ncbi:hypothetical protein Tdes44962_MAKER05524 [Teratosphaeria destructans]|uniref:Uncharacterized protein n=1 Tax=Teratosphaeria destructans TaxID=418781 RepID=A0A9W7VYL6_9PEZI|nr:hypothetical protein Tdes44962_MAKER05524 [Teratosphaeria destructans]